jgi:PAS domain S-box-containing protein
MPMGVWPLGTRGAELVFGYKEEEILGEDGSILFTPEDRRSGTPEQELKKAQTEGRAEDERWHMRKDGSRFWANGFVRPVRDEGGNLLGFSKVARDLTQRKRAEEAVDEVRRAEWERLARDLHDLALQDLISALQAAEAHRLTQKEDEDEGVEDLREMIDSLRRASQGVLWRRLHVRARPLPVTVAAVLLALFSLLTLICPWLLAAAEIPAFVVYLGVVLGVAGLLAAAGLWMLKRWSVWLTIVVCVVGILSTDPGLTEAPTVLLRALATVGVVGAP